jgi:hypothetical protein
MVTCFAATSCTSFGTRDCGCGCFNNEPKWEKMLLPPAQEPSFLSLVATQRSDKKSLPTLVPQGDLAHGLWFRGTNNAFLLCIPEKKMRVANGCNVERYILSTQASQSSITDASVICMGY